MKVNRFTTRYINTHRLQKAMRAGASQVAKRYEHLNTINVFPVADGDTGTNLMFTMTAMDAVNLHAFDSLTEYTQQLARAAVDGARGNSGAIFAQFLQGLHEGLDKCLSKKNRGTDKVSVVEFSEALCNASRMAKLALVKPVKGTMVTVMKVFSETFRNELKLTDNDLKQAFENAYKATEMALSLTPEQLLVLKEAGVVDAGAQGFLDFLAGIYQLLEKGDVVLPETSQVYDLPDFDIVIDHTNPEHRFCTECLIEGNAMQRQQILRELQTLDASSAVIAGDATRLRVHIHVDRPDEVFRLCGLHGVVTQQKADDMYRQMNVVSESGNVSIVTDSACDLPEELFDELSIHRVCLRFNFGGRDFLDRISMTTIDFYRHLIISRHQPQTSQPPVGDYRRVYSLLRGQRRRVMTLSLAASLSGSYQAAESAADDDKKIEVIDTFNASAGQGLLVIAAAELAKKGYKRDHIRAHLSQLIPLTKTYAITKDLSYAARGGRVKPWVARLAKLLFLQPILNINEHGQLKPVDVMYKRRDQKVSQPLAFGRWLAKRLSLNKSYRIMITHGNAPTAAETLRDQLIKLVPNVDTCWVSETGPAIGVHAGPGVLVVGVQESGDEIASKKREKQT